MEYFCVYVGMHVDLQGFIFSCLSISLSVHLCQSICLSICLSITLSQPASGDSYTCVLWNACFCLPPLEVMIYKLWNICHSFRLEKLWLSLRWTCLKWIPGRASRLVSITAWQVCGTPCGDFSAVFVGALEYPEILWNHCLATTGWLFLFAMKAYSGNFCFWFLSLKCWRWL